MSKKIIKVSLLWLIIGAATVPLYACYTGNHQTVAAPQKSDSPTTVKHHSYQKKTMKPGASVKILNLQPMVLNTAGLHDIELVLHSASYPGEMNIDLTASDGMSILSAAVIAIPLVKKGEYKIPVSLNIPREGRYYLRMNVTVTGKEINEKRVLSAIIQVGETVDKQQKTVPASTTDKVVSLPAQEHVTSQD